MNLDFSLQQLSQNHRIIKSKQKCITSQEWYYADPQPISEIRDADIDYYFRGQHKTVKAVFDFLLCMNEKYRSIWCSQKYIGDYVGIGRQRCNRIIKQLVADGLIATRYHYKDTCEYKVSSYFKNPSVRSQLMHHFRAFKILPLLLLASISSYSAQQATVLINQGNKDYNNNYTHPRARGGHLFSSTEKANIIDQITKGVYKGNPIDPSIRGLMEFHLTKWGQIKLSPFPPVAITHGRTKMAAMNGPIRSKFNCLYTICLNYCKDNDITPDWQWGDDLAKAYNMPKAPQWMYDPSIPPRRLSSIATTIQSSRARAASTPTTSATTRSGMHKIATGIQAQMNFVEYRERKQLSVKLELDKMSPEEREITEKRRAAYAESLQKYKPKNLE